MTQKILEKWKKYQNSKKPEICLNERETPPTRERAKRADQHVYASARKIKKINMMTQKIPKIKILTVIRTPSHSHFVLAAFRPSNSPFGLVFGLKRRPSVRPPASLWDVKTPKKNATFPTFFLKCLGLSWSKFSIVARAFLGPDLDGSWRADHFPLITLNQNSV